MEIEEQYPSPTEESRETERLEEEIESDSASALEAVEEHFTSAGLLLANAREQLGLSTYEVSVRLHLTEHYVRALEAGEYDKLPGEVYVRGYLKSYALLLGVNVEQILSAYQQPGAPAAIENSPAHSEPARFNRNWIALILLVLLVVVAGAIVALGWWAYQTFGSAAGTVIAAVARHKHGDAQ